MAVIGPLYLLYQESRNKTTITTVKATASTTKLHMCLSKYVSGTDEEELCKRRIGKQQKSGKLIGPNFCGQLPL